MNCQRVQRFLSLYHDGHPAGREADAIASHLRDCPACHQFREALAALGAKVRIADETQPAPRPDLRSRALDRWSAQRDAAGTSASSGFATRRRYDMTLQQTLRRWPVAVGAALLVAALGLAWWQQSGRNSAKSQDIAQTAPHGSATPPKHPGLPLEKSSPGLQVARGSLPKAETQPRNNEKGVPQFGGVPRLRGFRIAPNHAASTSHSGTRRMGRPIPPASPAPASPLLPDPQYLDGRDPSLFALWNAVDNREQARLRAILSKLPPPADDFVQIPFPQIAAAGDAGIAAAKREYETQAKVVDARLFRKVTLQDKGIALSDFCAELQAQTGVELRASRSVADEKVTVFVKEEPTRDLMRAVSHLFGYLWMRSGRDGEYRYELNQDLRSQLAEEEMRRRDQDDALLAMDEQMQGYRPYLDLSFDEFQKRVDQMPVEQRRRFFRATVAGGWGGMQLYHHLTPRDQAALLAGEELIFRPDDPIPERRLSPEFAHQVLMSDNPHVAGEDRPVGELPGARVTQVGLRLERTELGQVQLLAHTALAWPEKYGDSRTAQDEDLAIGHNPSTEKPDNAAANAALRSRPPFDRVVSLHPEPTCPQVRAALAGHSQRLPYGLYSAAIGDLQLPHAFSADVWEAVHRATGLPIVADYYTRMYRLDAVTIEHKPMFEALCTVSDALRVRWRKEGDFLLGRSTSYYWDKRKEVPNRNLLRWQREERDGPGLSIDTLMEMASLPDEELNSIVVGEAIQHCWGLEEWGMIMPTPFQGDTTYRQDLRFLAELTPEHRRRALAPGGMPMREMTPAEQQGFMKDWVARGRSAGRLGGDPTGPPDVEHGHYVVEYVPAGWYVWTPPESSPEHPWPRDLYRIVGRTAAEALAGARQIYPAASVEQVTLCKVGELHPGFSFGPYPNGWKPARG